MNKMRGKRFSNQSQEQIISHLYHFLNENTRYNLSIDPLGIRFVITESTKKKKKPSEKRKLILGEQRNMSKRQRRLSNTKKRVRPKIRTVKKGRTVPLKGRVY
ncbi:MAG: hypothetical protein DRO62_02230 [Candidatus Altiarchaeales archaeon]|nr:MAG: hypothetical protein DRO62_02230 [Candidatus Altiarchaeales archaeon]